MRTTVELPPELLRAAKAWSAESGESLKSLLTRAVAAELDLQNARRGQPARVRLPLFGDATGPRVKLTNADLARALADDDVAQVKASAKGAARKGKGRRAT
jgi:hypothetical protein